MNRTLDEVFFSQIIFSICWKYCDIRCCERNYQLLIRNINYTKTLRSSQIANKLATFEQETGWDIFSTVKHE